MDDLRLLKVLREVALRGSFSAAADALSYSQPAISQQIKRLEQQAGVRLIEREPKAIRLTPAGAALVRHTELILKQLADAEAELGELAAEARGRIRLAAFATAAGTFVPQAVAEFRRRRPNVDVQLSLVDPPQSIPALRRGELDVAITEEAGFAGDPDLRGLEVEHLLDDPLWVSLPAAHPLATRKAIDLTDLRDDDWMLVGLTGTCADSNIVLRACRDAGFEPRVAYTSDDYFAIQGLVSSGMGVALVPGLALAGAHDGVAIRPVAGRPPYRRIGAVVGEHAAGGATATMLDCLRDAAAARGERRLSAAA